MSTRSLTKYIATTVLPVPGLPWITTALLSPVERSMKKLVRISSTEFA
jgi:hypothetical protein